MGLKTSDKCTDMVVSHQASAKDVRTVIGGRQALAGLYLHVPFCFHKCGYCDFYSIVDKSDRQARFADALIAEFHQVMALGGPLRPRTIFIGGGTPTLLAAPLWERLLTAIEDAGVLEDVVEFTVEANPETVTDELAAILQEGGVNRVSIGCQSFNLQHLKVLERWHDPATVPLAMERFRAAGIANLNLDLIYAIPGQSLADAADDLDRALALNPSHLSCYSLTFEPNTALTQLRDMGKVTPPDEETGRAMFEQVMTRLDKAGFQQYEISNWAKRSDDGRETRCLHNLMYWRNENWIGIGPSASSHVDGLRWKNDPHLGRYIAAAGSPTFIDIERLPESQRIGEQLMLALRLNDGVCLQWLEEVLATDNPRQAEIEMMVDNALLIRSDGRLRLSHEGIFLANAVIERLL